ncbi:type VI secretion system protein TssA [Oryzifoliimicrobium ureilyticus]|uniref:type VI secretion system protein TssA n=1 Tax=Oryzifoliimicrobium ureilyticus TaxID=3113724 RepID=UPI0030764BD6
MSTDEVKLKIEYSSDCGENIRAVPRLRELYYRLKDERNKARTEERTVDPDDVLKISPAWINVSNLGLQIISSESRDLEVLAWLAEAHLRLRGFHGLREIYETCIEIFSQHWEALRSIDDDDLEEKFAPFSGLNGVGSEGTLVQPLRLTSLIPGGKFAEWSLWDFQLAQRGSETKRREALQAAASEVGSEALSAHLTEVNKCLAAFDAMMAILSEKCGPHAPASSNIRNTLIEVAAAIRALGGRDIVDVEANPQVDENVHGDAGDGGTQTSHHPALSRSFPEGIASREEAFEHLLNIARFFRRTEPHSPISMAIETLVRRGRMDFSELLAELLPEAQARNSVLTAAGIKPHGEN